MMYEAHILSTVLARQDRVIQSVAMYSTLRACRIVTPAKVFNRFERSDGSELIIPDWL